MDTLNKKFKPTGSKEIDQILLQAHKRIEDSKVVIEKIDRAVSEKIEMSSKK
ncbi:hypothetical protein [Lysinibacillus xylanilyticus]|uniref:hypothetical protein n=1 Tax=Lysinibacillus xylanilyticus TaxID=582475 RepID=UPI003810CD08